MTTAVPSAEYVYGTHAGAIANAENVKSQVWRSAKGGALPRIGAFIVSAPLFMDLSGSAAHFQSAQSPASVTVKLGNFVSTAQVLPDQIQSVTESPQFNPQGSIVSWQDASPEIPWDLKSVYSAPVAGAQAATGKPPPYQNAAPAFIDLSGSGYWTPVSPNPQGRLQSFVNGAPAFIDLSGYALTVAAAFNRQGPTIAQFSGAPPWMELTLPSWIQAAVATPPVLIHGPTVATLPQAYTAPDLTINYSATFTPSTFSPSAPSTVVPDTHDGLPKRHKRKYDDSAQTQVIRESRLKPKKAAKPAAVVEALKPLFVNVVADTPEDEEALIALMQRQDDEILEQIELATHLLRTLH